MNFRKFLRELNSSHEVDDSSVNYHALSTQNVDDLSNINLNDCTFYLEMDGDNYHNAPIVGFVLGNGNDWYVSRDIEMLKSTSIKSILETQRLLKMFLMPNVLTLDLIV